MTLEENDMKMCSVWILIAAVCALPSAAIGHAVTIKLSLSDSVLVEQMEVTPKIQVGDSVVVVVTNVETPMPSWEFKLGGVLMDSVMEGNLRCIGKVTERMIDNNGQCQIIFRDTTDMVRPYSCIMEMKGEPVAKPKAAREIVGRQPVYDRKKNEIHLYFDEYGLPDGGSFPRDIDDNDIINIYIVAEENAAESYSINITGNFANDEYSLMGKGAISGIGKIIGQTQSTKAEDTRIDNYMGSFGPYGPPSIVIEIQQRQEDGKIGTIKSYPMKINKNYFAALTFGVGQSDIRFSNYTLARIAGSEGTLHIKDRSDPDGEPRYFLGIILYNWRFWEPRFWEGRDLNETPRFSERINPFVGVGLADFGDEYFIGASLELARGLSIAYSYHIARIEVLNGGFSEHDEFDGSKADLPVQDEWMGSGSLGVALDLVIAASMLGVLGGGK